MAETILVTGANGQLGKSLQEISSGFSGKYHFLFTDVDTLDITDKAALLRVVSDEKVSCIINAAGYTDVNKAESDVEKAYLLNETAVANLAEAAKSVDAFFVHISTDYVFDGTATEPYPVDAPTGPVSVYGKSKLAGELAARRVQCRGAIIRTAWLYSPYGNNFVKTMLRLADTRDSISVVSDQVGCPTLALDLGRFIMTVVDNKKSENQMDIYHFSDKGKISWYDFTVEILRLANKNCPVNPIPTSAYPTPAARPSYSVFDLSKSEAIFNIPDWKESLAGVMPKILHHYENNIR